MSVRKNKVDFTKNDADFIAKVKKSDRWKEVWEEDKSICSNISEIAGIISDEPNDINDIGGNWSYTEPKSDEISEGSPKYLDAIIKQAQAAKKIKSINRKYHCDKIAEEEE